MEIIVKKETIENPTIANTGYHCVIGSRMIEIKDRGIEVNEEDEKWFRGSVVNKLVEYYNYSIKDAVNLFVASPLIKMLHENPEDIFHKSIDYWTEWLITMKENEKND